MREESNLGRRDFLQQSAAGAVGASSLLAATPSLLAATESVSADSLHRLSPQALENLVGRRFHVNGSSLLEEQQTGTLILEKVESLPSSGDVNRPSNIRPHAISLLFKAASGDQLVAGTHRVSGTGFTATELLLQATRVSEQSTQSHYEAVLN